MWFNVVLLILLQLFAIGNSSPIVRGQDVGKVIQDDGFTKVIGQDKFPFMAYVRIVETDTVNPKIKTGSAMGCGGVIILKNAVLTAAHCLVNYVSKPEIYVQAGIVHLDYEKTKGQIKKVTKHVVHENYVDECPIDDDKFEFCLNDIAFLWIKDSFIFNEFVNRAILSRSTNTLLNKSGWIMGWGNNENGVRMKMLQKTYMNVVSNEDCTISNNEVVITDQMICLISKDKTSGSCDGDSGGPFVVNGLVYGISSFHPYETIETNETRCDTTIPAVYTNVGFYDKWITKQLLELSQSVTSHCKYSRLGKGQVNN